MVEFHIVELDISDFGRCASIWDMEGQAELAERFRSELAEGIRVTYVCEHEGEYIAEISLVFHTDDPEYTVPGRRAYVSHLTVKKQYRRQGIGRSLLDFVVRKGRELGLSELSVGVDLDNYPALMLYVRAGFDRILFAGEDGQGRYLKLMRSLYEY